MTTISCCLDKLPSSSLISKFGNSFQFSVNEVVLTITTMRRERRLGIAPVLTVKAINRLIILSDFSNPVLERRNKTISVTAIEVSVTAISEM